MRLAVTDPSKDPHRWKPWEIDIFPRLATQYQKQKTSMTARKRRSLARLTVKLKSCLWDISLRPKREHKKKLCMVFFLAGLKSLVSSSVEKGLFFSSSSASISSFVSSPECDRARSVKADWSMEKREKGRERERWKKIWDDHSRRLSVLRPCTS